MRDFNNPASHTGSIEDFKLFLKNVIFKETYSIGRYIFGHSIPPINWYQPVISPLFVSWNYNYIFRTWIKRIGQIYFIIINIMTRMQTEGLDSYGCFSIENHKFICICLKNSILETMSLQQSCWNLILNFCLSSVQSRWFIFLSLIVNLQPPCACYK